jgi:hypothetical protein
MKVPSLQQGGALLGELCSFGVSRPDFNSLCRTLGEAINRAKGQHRGQYQDPTLIRRSGSQNANLRQRCGLEYGSLFLHV